MNESIYCCDGGLYSACISYHQVLSTRGNGCRHSMAYKVGDKVGVSNVLGRSGPAWMPATITGPSPHPHFQYLIAWEDGTTTFINASEAHFCTWTRYEKWQQQALEKANDKKAKKKAKSTKPTGTSAAVASAGGATKLDRDYLKMEETISEFLLGIPIVAVRQLKTYCDRSGDFGDMLDKILKMRAEQQEPDASQPQASQPAALSQRKRPRVEENIL